MLHTSRMLPFLSFILQLVFANAAKYARDPPKFTFDVYNIKTPQLIGIMFGCIVFFITISSVGYLLYKSGTFDRLQSEMSTGEGIKFPKVRNAAPQISEQPELYDSLVEASQKLPLKIQVTYVKGKDVAIRALTEKDYSALFDAGNGDAFFTESAYDPERLWGWLPNFPSDMPYSDLETFKSSLREEANSSHVVLLDPVVDRVIGMASLLNNNPKNLSVQIGRPNNPLDSSRLCGDYLFLRQCLVDSRIPEEEGGPRGDVAPLRLAL